MVIIRCEHYTCAPVTVFGSRAALRHRRRETADNDIMNKYRNAHVRIDHCQSLRVIAAITRFGVFFFFIIILQQKKKRTVLSRPRVVVPAKSARVDGFQNFAPGPYYYYHYNDYYIYLPTVVRRLSYPHTHAHIINVYFMLYATIIIIIM